MHMHGTRSHIEYIHADLNCPYLSSLLIYFHSFSVILGLSLAILDNPLDVLESFAVL